MLRLLTTVLAFSLLFTACGEEQSSPATTAAEVVDTLAVPTSPAPAPAPENDNELVTWVDRINVRSAPNTSGEVVARVPNGEVMTFTGETSSAKDAILLRSVLYQEPWLKVVTKDGQEGWVFGGAVKRPNEQKGNEIISATSLDFPYFGRYDLSGWKALDTSESSGGDAESTTKRYQQGAQMLAVTETDMGDYGYRYFYQLMDVEEQVLLERELIFLADQDLLLRETVTNRIESPAVEYKRSEKLPQHPGQLGGRPLLVNGEWAKREL